MKKLVIVLLGLLSTAFCNAETPEFEKVLPPPPVREITDSHGINMGSGQTNIGGMSVSIGGEGSGIARDPGGKRYLHDNHTGTITKITIVDVNSKDPRELDGLSAGTYYKVDAQGNSEIFRYSSGNYVDFKETGGVLSCTSSTCTYENKQGLEVRFNRSIKNGLLDCYYATTAGTLCSSPHKTYYENIAMQSLAIYPNGEEITYTYRPSPGQSSLSKAYISAAESSLGWMIKYYFSPKTMTQPSGNKYVSEVDRSVTAINTAVEYCNPGATHCNGLSNTWRTSEMHAKQTLTYGNSTTSNWNSSVVSNITNDMGFTDSYLSAHDDMGYSYSEGSTSFGGVASSFYKPGCAYYNGSCTPTSISGKVQQVTQGQYIFNYSFASTPTSPDGQYVIDMSRFRPTSYTDNLGRQTRYTYYDQWKTRVHKIIAPDATGSASDPSGGYTEYVYDGRGNIEEIRQYPKGGGDPLVQTAEYPSSCANRKTCNKPTSITDANGVTKNFTYHGPSGNIETVTWPAVDGDRAQIRFTYEQKTPKVRNSSGSLVNSDPVWKLTEVSKCLTGDLNSCVGTANEHRTVFVYAHNNLLLTSRTERSGDGSIALTTTMGYDKYGNLSWQDGPRSGTNDRVYFYYDALGQKIGEIGVNPDGSGPLKRQGTRTYYNGDGQVTQVKTGVVSSVSLSALNSMYAQEKAVTDYQSGLVVKEKFYAEGLLKRVVQKTYDAKARLQCEAVRLNPATFNSLPSSACSLGTKGPDGDDRITKYTYDATDAVVSVIKAYGTTAQQVYKKNNYRSDNGLLQSIEDGLQNTTFYYYDDFNRLEETRYPDPNNGSAPSSTDRTVNTYTDGRITSQRLRDGSVVNLGYDDKGRVESKSGAISEQITYNHFDQKIELVSYETGGSKSTTKQQYNALGWKEWEKVYYSTSLVSTVSYDHDSYGRRNRVTWPDGFYVTYDYNVSGYPSDYVQSIRENGSLALATYTYDDFGRVEQLTRGNGVVTDYVYDDESRLEMMSTDLSGSSNDIYEAFSYTVSGQLKSKDVDVSNSTYRFNPGSNSTKNYAVNDLNQLTSVSGASVGYDARGNLRTRSGYTYSYLDNNLLKSVVKSGVTTTLVYDAEKRLFSIAKSGTTTRFVHDGSRMIAETNASGTVQNRYVHGIGTDDPLVWYVGSGTSSRRYYTKDHQGSIVGGSYNSGSSAFINAYDEYGVNASGNQGRFRYTGQIWLHEVGLYYYKARMYDPEIGRFMQTDPIGYKDGINWYVYVGGDPVNKSDSTGKYGQGRGFSRGEWRRFDKAQKEAASKFSEASEMLKTAANELANGGELSAATEKLIGEFEDHFGTQSDLVGALSTAADYTGRAAEALADDGSKGFIAHGISSQDWQGNRKAAARAVTGGRTMYINKGHGSVRRSGSDLQHILSHEATHNAGLSDFLDTGGRAYCCSGDEALRSNYDNMLPHQAVMNPDRLVEFIF